MRKGLVLFFPEDKTRVKTNLWLCTRGSAKAACFFFFFEVS